MNSYLQKMHQAWQWAFQQDLPTMSTHPDVTTTRQGTETEEGDSRGADTGLSREEGPSRAGHEHGAGGEARSPIEATGFGLTVLSF